MTEHTIPTPTPQEFMVYGIINHFREATTPEWHLKHFFTDFHYKYSTPLARYDGKKNSTNLSFGLVVIDARRLPNGTICWARTRTHTHTHTHAHLLVVFILSLLHMEGPPPQHEYNMEKGIVQVCVCVCVLALMFVCCSAGLCGSEYKAAFKQKNMICPGNTSYAHSSGSALRDQQLLQQQQPPAQNDRDSKKAWRALANDENETTLTPEQIDQLYG